MRMKVYTRKIIILVHTYRKNCTHKNLVCILDYGWWGVFTEFCSDSTAVCLYLVDESKTTTTNPDETSFLLIFYICSRLLKEFFDMEEQGHHTHDPCLFFLCTFLFLFRSLNDFLWSWFGIFYWFFYRLSFFCFYFFLGFLEKIEIQIKY